MARFPVSSIESMTPKELRTLLKDEGVGLNVLVRCRRSLNIALAAVETSEDQKEKIEDLDEKLRLIESLMRKKIKNGETVKKRRPGTGEKRVTQHVYQDTPGNRRLDRVGKTYEKVMYVNGEITEASIKLRRRRRVVKKADDATPRANAWIKAVQFAKEELGAPKFVIIRRESSVENDIGVKVYNRARELMKAAGQMETIAPMNPTSVTSSAVEVVA